ncbi:hypothetical protein JL721_2954 [Aureococcus anophagefferens]|nr:hypothetical protein JL721_2954 [Aureococcus anophagefferens]
MYGGYQCSGYTADPTDCDKISSRYGLSSATGSGCASRATPRPTPRPTPQPTPRPTPSPTPRPTPSPTPRPTPSPSTSPSPSPTARPKPRTTPRPSPSPTLPFASSAPTLGAEEASCSDSVSWYRKKSKYDCDWLRERTDKCKKKGVDDVRGRDACPVACGECPSECEDSASWYYKKSKKTCEAFVSKKSKNCKKKDEFGTRAKDACKVTCGKCDDEDRRLRGRA